MRAAWRLAITSLFERASRTGLIIGTVVLSAALIAAVACALGSVNRAVDLRMEEVVGRADLKIKPASGRTFGVDVLARVRAWPEVRTATGRLLADLGMSGTVSTWAADPDPAARAPFRRADVKVSFGVQAIGIEPLREGEFRGLRLLSGRMPAAMGEIVLDDGATGGLRKQAAKNAGDPAKRGEPDAARPGAPATAPSAGEAERLSNEYTVGVGDSVSALRLLRKPIPLRVVGIVAQPPFGGRWQAFVTREQLAAIMGSEGRLSEVDAIVRAGVDPQRVVELHKAELGKAAIVQTTAKITSGLADNMQSNQLGFYLATTMAFLAASFIIMTGLSTGVVEKQRELAVLRCIGATKGQLAASQLLTGALVGLIGACIGIPVGIGVSGAMVRVYHEHVPAGLAVPPSAIITPLVAALVAGLLGAGYPAWAAASVSPMEGLGVRARPPRTRSVVLLLAAGLACIAIHVSIITLIPNGQVVFWLYVLLGLPAMFIGYFLLSVPALIVLTRSLGPVVGRALRLPGNMLARGVLATPFRYGFTAGAMMSGLAILVAIWTQGRAIKHDWLDKMEFPDAFAAGMNITPEARERLTSLPWITDSCAITILPVDSEVFGVHALQKYKTSFIAFEPEPFFRMTNLTWVQPTTEAEQQAAIKHLLGGGAVVVAREFLAAEGLGAGGKIHLAYADRAYDFDIVGVVTSPGLEVIGRFFETGDQFADQAVHAVFGTRGDLRDKFGTEAINILQVNLSKDISDEEAVRRMRGELLETGVFDVGSGRKLKQDLRNFIAGTLLVSSTIAIFVMIKSCLGVANIVIAGIQARRFEFGVLRAIGASRGLLCRLVLGEAILIALAAMVLGTLLGLEGVAGGQRLDKLLFGLELAVRPPIVPLAVGWGCVLLACVGAALPAILGLARRRPRELLGAMRG